MGLDLGQTLRLSGGGKASSENSRKDKLGHRGLPAEGACGGGLPGLAGFRSWKEDVKETMLGVKATTSRGDTALGIGISVQLEEREVQCMQYALGQSHMHFHRNMYSNILECYFCP